MAVARSFGSRVTGYADLEQALSFYASRAAEKLRRFGLATGDLVAFVQSSRHDPGPHYARQASVRFMEPVSDTISLVRAARRLLRRLWRSCVRYAKAGVMLNDLGHAATRQLPLALDPRRERRDALSEVCDEVNARYGRETVRLAATGVRRGWTLRADKRSGGYTTSWSDLPVAAT